MIDFCETDTETIKTEIISAYESLSGRALAQADPIRLFLLSMANVIVLQRNIINYSANMNLLEYAEGNYLDEIGKLVGCTRIAATSATTTILVTLSAVRPKDITVPAGTRVATEDNMIFTTDTELIIPAGDTTGTVTATALATGEAYNGYNIGDVSTIIDTIAYVSKMSNTTETDGGSDTETDYSYRERIRLAPESFSVAGPAGAYEYWTKTASSLITDVCVDSPTPGAVDIYPLLEGGKTASDEIKATILEILEERRPLTDNVSVKDPVQTEYNIDLTYYINVSDKTQENVIKSKVDNAISSFIEWQSKKLGRDINPSRLISDIISAGAKRVDVASPTRTVLASNAMAVCVSSTVNYGGVEDD